MNEIVNKFLLPGDTFIPEMHLKQPGFTYSACGPFTKNKERTQKFKETGDTKYIYKNEQIFTNYKLQIFLKFYSILKFYSLQIFDKNAAGSGVNMQIMRLFWTELKNYINQLLENLRKDQFIQDLKTIFGVLIWLICKFNEGFRFLLFVVDIFSKYTWLVL